MFDEYDEYDEYICDVLFPEYFPNCSKRPHCSKRPLLLDCAFEEEDEEDDYLW